MIDEADRDGDGEINEAEFLRIMKKTSLYWNTTLFEDVKMFHKCTGSYISMQRKTVPSASFSRCRSFPCFWSFGISLIVAFVVRWLLTWINRNNCNRLDFFRVLKIVRTVIRIPPSPFQPLISLDDMGCISFSSPELRIDPRFWETQCRAACAVGFL